MKPKRINKKQLRPIYDRLTELIDSGIDAPFPVVNELCEIAGDLSYLLDGE